MKQRMRIWLAITMIIMLLPALAITAAASSLDEDIAEIRDVLEVIAREGRFSGSVLIAHRGQPVFQAAYGMANRSLSIENQVSTKFNLGSMDKMFTAVAIMQLVDRGLLALDDTIDVYLPDTVHPEIANSATIHHLLSHTSGLGNYFRSEQYLETCGGIRSVSDYAALFADAPLQFPAGYGFSYSNSGYIVLGLIIEAVSGISYYEYVREHIFLPSSMLDTACYALDDGTANLALGYTNSDWEGNELDTPMENTSMLPMRGGSAGGGYSTATDLLSFVNALLGYELLGSDSTELLFEARNVLAPGVAYGYGFFNRLVEGQQMIGHGGGFAGICSMLNIYPDIETTVVVLSNIDGGCVEANNAINRVLLTGS